MLAAAVLCWILDVASGPMYVYPGYEIGTAVRGGFELSHAIRRHLSAVLTARAGATYIDAWRPVFEAAGGLSWRDLVDVHVGVRHDDQLRREGARANFRDPTGRGCIG